GLDPQAASIYKALVPLYVALGRTDDALAACQKTFDLDPGDYETWTLYARQLRNLGRSKEARTAFVRALACPGLADDIELRLQLYADLGALCEEAQDYDQAVAEFMEVVRILDNPQTSLDHGGANQAGLGEQAARTYERIIQLCIQAGQYERVLRI